MAVLTSLHLPRPSAAPALISSLVIRGDRCEHGGQVSAVLATTDLDIDALDPARKAAASASFARLCHTLQSPMQLLVRVRRLAAPVPRESDGPHPQLDAAMYRHWTEQIRDGNRHTRQVLVALVAATPAALDAACAHTTDRLAAIGVSAMRLGGDALVAAVTDGFDTNLYWYEHPKYAAIGDVMTRGHALRRLPGHPVEAGWLAPLLSVQTECDIAIHLVPAPLGEALGRLSRRLRDFSAHRMLEAERGALGDVHVDIGVDSASALRERLARNQGRPLHLSVVATVRGDTHEALDARSAALQLGFASSLIGVEVTNFRHMAALMSTLPLGLDVARRRQARRLHGGGDLRALDRSGLRRSGWLPARRCDPIRASRARCAVRHLASSEPERRGLRGLRTRQELRNRHPGARGCGRRRELGDHRSGGRVSGAGRQRSAAATSNWRRVRTRR